MTTLSFKLEHTSTYTLLLSSRINSNVVILPQADSAKKILHLNKMQIHFASLLSTNTVYNIALVYLKIIINHFTNLIFNKQHNHSKFVTASRILQSYNGTLIGLFRFNHTLTSDFFVGP